MGGPSGQKNKTHKAGRRAGPSARERARQGKEVAAPRAHPKSAAHDGKLQRHLAARQQRDAKRQELLERKRKGAAPVVVAVLPLSEEVDVARFWHGLRHACEASLAPGGPASGAAAGASGSGSAGAGGDMELELLMSSGPLAPTTVTIAARSRVRLTLLPPPPVRGDPLAVADLGRCAEVVLLLLPGGEPATAAGAAAAAAAGAAAGVDAAGQAALAVLRAMGMPSIVPCVVGAGTASGSGSGAAAAASMKDRSAAKKRAEKALAAHLAGEHRLLHADTPTDLAALARHLAEHPPSAPPLWRQQRPGVMVEKAEYEPEAAGPGPSSVAAAAAAAGGGEGGAAGGGGVLTVYGFVRGTGLSANQLVTVPGAGDFRILSIHGPPDPHAVTGRHVPAHQAEKAMDVEAGAAGGAGPGPVVAQPDAEEADVLVRENVPAPGEGEQTWPTEEEMEAAAAAAPRMRKKKVPEGTSEYQAAWILDDEDYGTDDEDGSEDESDEDPYGMDADDGGRRRRGGAGDAAMGDDAEAPELQPIDDDDDAATDAGEAMALDEEGGDAAYAAALEAAREAKARRRGGDGEAEAAQLDFPDEVDVPLDQPARVRFQKYRGLKSLRTSAWDPKESLPADYARVFAFENFKRAHKRAREAAQRATSDLDPCAVAPGSYVAIRIGGVPPEAAERVLAAVAAAAAGQAVPLTVFGLMQHEAKLSVVNFAMRKAAGYSAPVANKERLLLVTGLRSFTARPILSTDDPGADKHRMEKFVHDGQHVVASVYAPIMYPPLPLLAFKLPEPAEAAHGAQTRLAAVGALRGCDPDRINLKRIMLTGTPVRVHRRRATVRFMFHNPDDVRWFRPVELSTKYGRRGRITEPLGTHGAMKCLFDSPLQQRDTVCMPLYKRVFPVWPSDMSFAER
ncbi:hypothetical protein HYH03_000032 [Edaphochlamys debaryana]|uniref:Bms1-type G domain-containing protein n=1 Tax=Edaphochlamys debaryana TaxID=47281 RepID=A0A835YET7_9CHLO|nr:hypothetical protein HYH03_000032 [Edaphochlamys debaryana]|eukprot:KAG2501525.1 hypothetical protein HYH03_000032 [Edaphochlamys debaryana]